MFSDIQTEMIYTVILQDVLNMSDINNSTRKKMHKWPNTVGSYHLHEESVVLKDIFTRLEMSQNI